MTPTTRTPSASAIAGRLMEWHDAKGYGWVEVGGRRIFAHIKEFEPGQRRPMMGDELIFTPGIDSQGRPQAKTIRLTRQTTRIGAGAWLWLAVLLALPVTAGLRLPGLWWLAPTVLATASVPAWMLYARDKRKARQGEWRIQESTLHLAALCGGWPGAFLAQRRYRHKTTKASFQAMFWTIVLLHQAAAVDVLLSHAPSRWLIDEVQAFLEACDAERRER